MHKTRPSIYLTIASLLALCVSGASCSSASSDDNTGGSPGTTPSASTSSGGGGGTTSSGGGGGDGTRPMNVGTAELPATGAEAEVKSWIAMGEYKKGTWKCETAPHAARSPSPHGTNRICSNAMLSAHGTGEFPVGAAAVKELYQGETVIGHAMYRKLAAGGAESWYWYEEMNGQVVANDLGSTGGAKTICVGCHAGAGMDADHSGHDFVYTQVK